jgi:DNA-binding transcriptional regulator YdaS (Cro superfamily)
MRESLQQRNARLAQSGDCGRALLSVIQEFGSSVLLAEKIGVASTVISTWVQLEKISMRGARLLAEATGREKEEFRPDLSAKDWERKFPGPVPGQDSIKDSEDARLLADLAKKFGGVPRLCGVLGVSVSIYHNWKSRGKIPVRRRETIRALAAK